MDLGIESLTDDQLLELLQQACAALAQREHYVRSAAQAIILDEATKMQVAKQAIKEALDQVRQEYIHQLNQEVLASVREGVRTGEIRLHADQEANLIAQAALQARATIIDETIAGLKKGPTQSRFFCEIRGDIVTVSFGTARVQHRHALTPQQVDGIAAELRALLG